jgi:hypothetical protein
VKDEIPQKGGNLFSRSQPRECSSNAGGWQDTRDCNCADEIASIGGFQKRPVINLVRRVDLWLGNAKIALMKRLALTIVLMCSCMAVSSCKSSYYAAYEKMGVYKRDLLKKRVVQTRDDEKKAQTQFQDALTRLKAITGFQGGKLESEYRKLQSQYDAAASRVNAVHQRIKQVDTVAKDLFAEWESENRQISTPSLRQTSERQLAETRVRYDQLFAALKRSESGMDPVLQKLHDYVLALKHSLNAQAIASLQGESINIQSDISQLIQEMNASIAQADEFIRHMQQQ